ncbi:MAG: PKD domain-containing protein [Thermoplasmata archaeon]
MPKHEKYTVTKTASMLIAVVLTLLFLQCTMTGVSKAQTQYTTLKGYLIDASDTGIGNAQISISGIDTEYTNSTQTGYDGYYEINVPNGYASIRASAAGYQEYINILNIYDTEYWNNITLQPSVETMITGYVFNDTGAFLNNVTITARDIHSSNGNVTTTDFDGFYEIKTEYSLVILTAARESCNLYVTVIDLSQNIISWLNITMDQLPIAVAKSATYTETYADINENISFDASASTDDYGIDAYYWEFGDGTNDTGKNVTHGYSAIGTYMVNLTVVDTVGGVGIDTFVVTVINATTLTNHAPVIELIPDQSATVGTPFTYQITATDEDDDMLTYSIDTNVVSINSTGCISGTLSTIGTHTINLTVSDGKSDTTAMFNLIVTTNNAPTISVISPQIATVGTEFTYLVNATDQDNDKLVYNTSIGIITSAGLFKYTPKSAGEINVKITADDGKGGVTNTTFTLTVKEKPATAQPKGFVPGFEIAALLSIIGLVLLGRKRLIVG